MVRYKNQMRVLKKCCLGKCMRPKPCCACNSPVGTSRWPIANALWTNHARQRPGRGTWSAISPASDDRHTADSLWRRGTTFSWVVHNSEHRRVLRFIGPQYGPLSCGAQRCLHVACRRAMAVNATHAFLPACQLAKRCTGPCVKLKTHSSRRSLN